MFSVTYHDLLLICVKMYGVGEHKLSGNTITITKENQTWVIILSNYTGPIEKYIFSDNNKQVVKETSSLNPLLPELIWIEIKERLIYNA